MGARDVAKSNGSERVSEMVENEKNEISTDISAKELEQLYDEIDAEIERNGLPAEDELKAEIEKLKG